MEEVLKIFIGIFFLALGFPLGKILAKKTKEELRERQTLFKVIIFSSLIAGFVSLFFRNDVLMFSFFFISIVVSGSLIKRKK